MQHQTASDDRLLTVNEAAELVGLSVAGFWRSVASGRFPDPVYPASASPRWFKAELLKALLETRAKPSAAMAARRKSADGRRIRAETGEAA